MRSSKSQRATGGSAAGERPRGLDAATQDLVRRAIVRDLNVQDRLLLVLCFVERMSLPEIAAVLNVAPTQVEALLARVVERVRAASAVAAAA
jgi:DNA-directed RNA polymerase specialized sigma24 family protein